MILADTIYSENCVHRRQEWKAVAPPLYVHITVVRNMALKWR